MVLCWLGSFVAEYAQGGDLYVQLVGTCFWSLAKFLAVLDHEGLVMRSETRQSACHWGTVFLRAYMALASHALQEGLLLFKVPKDHVFQEMLLALNSSSLNPRHTSCFGDESYVGKVCKLVRATHPLTAARRTLQRYVAFLILRWKKKDPAAVRS